MNTTNRNRLRLLLASMVVVSTPAAAGEIAGLKSNTPPLHGAPLEFSFSNDFLGRGGRSDDFRTQQFIIGGTIGDRWELAIDHSILTLVDGDDPGRTDQLTMTAGYRLINTQSATMVNRLTAGAGLRGYGDFAGERMQNGFHQLIRSGTEEVPYTDLDRTDGVVWMDAHRYALLHESGDWRWGYWLRGSALYTTDAQLDAALGGYAVGARKGVDFWLGLRQDWRSGYGDPVLQETAESEEALAAVIGVKWGPFVFETVQQFDGDGSYGQVRLLADGLGDNRGSSEQSRVVVDAGITVPDVHTSLTGRWRPEWRRYQGASWLPSLFATAGYGEPQLGDDPQVYLQAIQVGAGLEWERHLAAANGQASLYVSIGAGWRQEQVFGDGERKGEKSDSVNAAIVLGGLGIRVDAAELFRDYRLSITLGLTTWLPIDDASVTMNGQSFRVLQSTSAIALGMTLGRYSLR